MADPTPNAPPPPATAPPPAAPAAAPATAPAAPAPPPAAAASAPVTPPEPAKAPAPPATKEPTASSREVEKAKLLRDRAELGRQNEALASEKKALEARKAELEALAKAAPLDALKQLGKSPEEIAQLLLNGGKPVAEDPQAARIKELEAKLAEVASRTTTLADARAADEQRAKAAQEAADRASLVEDLRVNAAQVAPHVIEFGRLDDVIKEARRIHSETGEIDWTAAASAVEPKAREEFLSTAKRAIANPVLRAELEEMLRPAAPAAPAGAAPAPAAAPAAEPEKPADRFAELRPAPRNSPKRPDATVKHTPARRESFEAFLKRREAAKP